jgi:DNA invertase Pin-like site-specific DNA recombinase
MVDVLHIYTRVSTATQEEDGTSLDTQLELGIERAKKLGMDHRVWNEGGKSSSKDDLSNRPVLTDLLQAVDDGEVQHLYVWNTDRLSRNQNTWGLIRFKLVKNDVTLYTPTGKQILSDPQTNLMLGIMGEIAQYDNQLRTERFRLGKLKRIREGGWMGGPPPYGYSIKNSKLIPNDVERKWVKYIFTRYKNGDSIDDIRTKLLKNGVVTRRGNPVWSHGSIDKLLTNTHYEGFYTYTDKKSGDTLRVTCPAILDPTLIQSVRTLREKRSYGKIGNKRTKTSNQKYTYLLNGLLVCGHCGSLYGGNFKKTQTSYYSCLQKTKKYKTKYTDNHVECGANRNIRIDKTDQVVWETVVDIVTKSHTFKETVKTELLGKNSLEKSVSDIKRLKNKQKKLRKEVDAVTDSIVNSESLVLLGKRDRVEVSRIVKNLEKHRLSLESQIEEISQSLAADQQQKQWVDWVKEFGNRIEKLKDPDFTVEDRKKFLDGVVDKIEVFNKNGREHELKIEFRLPYVNDKLEFTDPATKSKGYTIKKGRRTKKIKTDLKKRQSKIYSEIYSNTVE